MVKICQGMTDKTGPKPAPTKSIEKNSQLLHAIIKYHTNVLLYVLVAS